MSLFEDSSLQRKLRRVSAFEIFQRETKRSHFAEVKCRQRDTLSILQKPPRRERAVEILCGEFSKS
jgi:hypothetical protein